MTMLQKPWQILSVFIAALALGVGLGANLPSAKSVKATAPAGLGSLQVVGSETMRQLMTTCAEDFMAKSPQADVQVFGGGTGDGIASVLHGMADIGMMSRALSEKEVSFARIKGLNLVVTDIALDGLAIVVHRSNPLTSIDLQRLKQIYTNQVSNWRDFGGADATIKPLGRPQGSGTAYFFSERVLGAEHQSNLAQALPTNEDIVAEVARNPAAIGYTGLGGLRIATDQVRVLALSAEPSLLARVPDAETVRSTAYPLTRKLSVAAAGPPSDLTRSFLAHCRSASGRNLILRAGYFDIRAVTP